MYTSSQMAPTRLVSARIILLSIGSRHPGANRRSDASERATRLEARKKKLASLHRESALIKAPFYTFRWHQGITSVSRYFFFFSSSPILFPFAPFFFSPSRFFCFAFFFFFLSFISFFFFFSSFVSMGPATRGI